MEALGEALGKMGWSPGLPHLQGWVLPRCPHLLLTGLHQLYEIGEENISVPLTKAADVIGDLEGGGMGGVRG